ncbi:MAG TPA: phosphoribosyltransferase family protein, partial [Acidimicrobiales bacterium]
GDELARAVSHPVDAVTWAPTGSRRAGRRGYDQAELLARAVARALGRTARATLQRCGAVPQTGLGARERRVSPAFGARRAVSGTWLVVDDVCTTGATLQAAAATLRRAGAAGVHAITVAYTTPHVRDVRWQAVTNR